MSETDSFQDLLCRVRAGDDQAATQLVRRYEKAIRAVVRARLHDPRLRRILDSTDICQSVLANFFVRAAAGEFELDEPDQLLKLLAEMTRNNLTNRVKEQQAARRDYRRLQSAAPDGDDLVDPHPDVCQIVASRELLEQFFARLTPEERRLAELRGQGYSWTEIAAEVGGHPDALRMRHSRAVQRVAKELGLE